MSKIEYKVGDKQNGLEVIQILHSTENSAVVILEGNFTHFEFKNLPFDESQILSKFHYLGSKLPKDLPKRLLNNLRISLAGALSSALLSNDIEMALTHFESVEKRIGRAKTTKQAKAVLIISCFVASLLMSVALLVFYTIDFWDNKLIFLSMSAGVLGSFFSLLSRNTKVHINHSGLPVYTFIQAGTIAITGALSGIIIYIFCYSNIAFGFAQENAYALLAVSVTAGFSERLIPDLFGKVEDLK